MESVAGCHLEKSVGAADTFYPSEWDRKATGEAVIRARPTLPKRLVIMRWTSLTSSSIQHTCDTRMLTGLTGHVAQEEAIQAFDADTLFLRVNTSNTVNTVDSLARVALICICFFVVA